MKGQSNWEIARTPRNAFRGSVMVDQSAGRATDRARGGHSLPTPDELRMADCIHGSEGRGAKVTVREGKNPEHRLRSLRIC